MSISKTVPTYRQLNPAGFFCSAHFLIEEGEAFEWEGEPNEHMEALNDVALERLKVFYAKLEEGAREVAKKHGRAYTGASKDLAEKIGEATADARRVELRSGDGGVPLMGVRKDHEPSVHVKKVVLEDTGPAVYRRTKG